jgi:flagella basal body P-ring formation protein FlgA
MIKNTLSLLALSLTLVTTSYAEQNNQSHEAIYELVKQTLTNKIKADNYEINVLPLDNLLKLPECTQALTAVMAGDVVNAGRITVGVRCDTGSKWSIFTSAIVKLFDQVLVLAQPIQQGEIISPQHLTMEKRDVSILRGDFITRVEQLENKQATRYLPKGTILSLKYFAEPLLIKRGDRVTISAIKTTFNIEMKGIAMSDGLKNQRISVKNESSGRIISATVIEAGRVLVQ